MSVKAVVMNEKEIERALERMAYEIVEKNRGADDLALIGIQRRGVSLAKRIAKIIEKTEEREIPVGILDITLYRDDLGDLPHYPVINGTSIHFGVDGKTLVVVDDVLFTGRTVRAAIDAIMDFGRPRAIRLAVLVDRGHRELPIAPDYRGKNIPTSGNEKVKVGVREIDGEDSVSIIDAQSGKPQ